MGIKGHFPAQERDKRKKNFHEALRYFKGLETSEYGHPTATINGDVRHIRECLAAEGKTIAALDRSGESTDEQMEERLQRAIKRKHLIGAQKDFSRLEAQETAGDIEGVNMYVGFIREHLREAGLSVSALDPTGNSTDEQMEERLQETVRNRHISAARKNFEDFETQQAGHSISSIEFLERRIREQLAEAGADITALDPSGKSTREEIEDRLGTSRIRAHIISARRRFGDLYTTEGRVMSIDMARRDIREHLDAAGTDASALDPSGKRQAAQMEDSIARAVREAHLRGLEKELVSFEEEGKKAAFEAARQHLLALGSEVPERDSFATPEAAAGVIRTKLESLTHDFMLAGMAIGRGGMAVAKPLQIKKNPTPGR
jgi:hypothetical protein